MAAAKRPLTLNELGEALSVEPGQHCFMPERLINDDRGIVRWCHGLITLYDLDDTSQFAHSSIKDFFCSPDTRRNIHQGFHFQQNEADRHFGEICVTYASFNDFKRQLVQPPKPQAFLNLDPMMVASHTLSTGSRGIVLNKAKAFMRTRSKSTPSTSKLLLSRGDDRVSHAIARHYHFFLYASEFWPSHTTNFSRNQGEIWVLFQSLAEERYPVLREPKIPTSLQESDDRVVALRNYMFSHQHQALFRQWSSRLWPRGDYPLILALIIRWKCFSFVGLSPLLCNRRSESIWSRAAQLLTHDDWREILQSPSVHWMKELTSAERSGLATLIVMTSYYPDNSALVSELVEFGVDPYHECDLQGKVVTLPDALIRGQFSDPLKLVCNAMLASNTNFEVKIAHPGRTVLHLAAHLRKPEAIKVLLEFGALLHATDDHGQTALHLAVQENEWYPEAMETLLDAGASWDIEDSYGNVALDYAKGNTRDKLMEFIRRRV